jgi:hypothetical protein
MNLLEAAAQQGPYFSQPDAGTAAENGLDNALQRYCQQLLQIN